MIVDFTVQSLPTLWAVVALLGLLAVVIFACLDPELAEVFFSDSQLLVTTMALAAVAIAALSVRVQVGHELYGLVPGR
jgi:hypothetical protein